MRTLSILDFKLSDFKKITSEFINKTFKNFLDNFFYLFEAHQKLNEKHDKYRVVTDKTFEFLNAYLSTLDPLIITAYSSFVEEHTNNVQINQGFGIVNLSPEKEPTSLIPLIDKKISSDIADIDNDNDGFEAIPSARIYKNGEEDINLRNIIDDTGMIWYEESTASTMNISLVLPTLDNKISYIEIFPYGGTKINKITFKGSNSDDVIDVDVRTNITDGFPLKLFVNKNDFLNEIIIELRGFASGSKFFYSLGYIKAYRASYVENGSVTYVIGNPGNLSDIEIVEPIIYPIILHEALSYPIDIHIFSTDGIDSGYNTGIDSVYPPDAVISLPDRPAGEEWLIKFTLKRTDGITPVFRKCILTTV